MMVLGQVRVSLYGNLRQAAGQKSVNYEGDLYAHLNVLVNGRDIRFLDGNLNYLLGDGDRVSLFPALSGGQKGII